MICRGNVIYICLYNGVDIESEAAQETEPQIICAHIVDRESSLKRIGYFPVKLILVGWLYSLAAIL